MMRLPTPFRFTSVYSFFPIWQVGRPHFCQIPHISQFETAQVQCACAAVGEPQFLFAIQLQSAHRSLPGIAGSYREYKGQGTTFLCGNFQRTIASAAIGNCKIGTGMQQKAAVARVGAIAQVGNILLGKNIAVRAILGECRGALRRWWFWRDRGRHRWRFAGNRQYPQGSCIRFSAGHRSARRK